MRSYISLERPRIFGAHLHLHWTALVAGGVLFGALIRHPLHAALSVLAYFGVILLHEAGHAFVARKLGYPPDNVYVGLLHGRCEFEHPDTLRDHALIAWGGVLAQLALAVPVLVVSLVVPIGSVSFLSLPVRILGFFNLVNALVNLAPVQGLDGAVAWRLVPIAWQDFADRIAAKKATRDVLRRFKERQGEGTSTTT